MSGPGRTAKTLSDILTKSSDCIPKATRKCRREFGADYLKCTYSTYTTCIKSTPNPKNKSKTDV